MRKCLARRFAVARRQSGNRHPARIGIDCGLPPARGGAHHDVPESCPPYAVGPPTATARQRSRRRNGASGLRPATRARRDELHRAASPVAMGASDVHDELERICMQSDRAEPGRPVSGVAHPRLSQPRHQQRNRCCASAGPRLTALPPAAAVLVLRFRREATWRPITGRRRDRRRRSRGLCCRRADRTRRCDAGDRIREGRSVESRVHRPGSEQPRQMDQPCTTRATAARSAPRRDAPLLPDDRRRLPRACAPGCRLAEIPRRSGGGAYGFRSSDRRATAHRPILGKPERSVRSGTVEQRRPRRHLLAWLERGGSGAHPRADAHGWRRCDDCLPRFEIRLLGSAADAGRSEIVLAIGVPNHPSYPSNA